MKVLRFQLLVDDKVLVICRSPACNPVKKKEDA